jgi:hypothetical protein
MPNRKKTYRPRKATYAKRNLVERFFNRLKHFRASPTGSKSTLQIISRSLNVTGATTPPSLVRGR